MLNIMKAIMYKFISQVKNTFFLKLLWVRGEEENLNLLELKSSDLSWTLKWQNTDDKFNRNRDWSEMVFQRCSLRGRCELVLSFSAHLPVPAVAAVGGSAWGGGPELALARDRRVAGRSQSCWQDIGLLVLQVACLSLVWATMLSNLFCIWCCL